jgi:hypothetical protein
MKYVIRTLDILIAALVAVAAYLAIEKALAVEPGWYAPLDGSGQGIIVRCNADDECAANWLSYQTEPASQMNPAALELVTVVEESTASAAVKNAASALADLPIEKQIWLISTNTCPQSAEVCSLEMAKTSGEWFGSSFAFDPETVSVELEQHGDSMLVDWNAVALFPDKCDTGIGGLLLENCIGVETWLRLAR